MASLLSSRTFTSSCTLIKTCIPTSLPLPALSTLTPTALSTIDDTASRPSSLIPYFKQGHFKQTPQPSLYISDSLISTNNQPLCICTPAAHGTLRTHPPLGSRTPIPLYSMRLAPLPARHVGHPAPRNSHATEPLANERDRGGITCQSHHTTSRSRISVYSVYSKSSTVQPSILYSGGGY